MNGEEPQMTILMLPDDLVLNCLARVSRLYYPTLSLVSKRFRSLLASTELYQTRTLLGRSQSCLYVCLRCPTDSNPLRWFTLCLRPHSSRKILVPISTPNIPSFSDVAVVGPDIYVIGGLINRKDNNADASSSVTVMDCRSHKWREAPNMRVARVTQSACAFDGNIYVTGGCKNLNSTNWMEVFNTNTQTWEFLKIPNEEICSGSEYKSVGYEGTIYVRSEEKKATYKLNKDKGKWRAADLEMNNGWGRTSSYCVIDNVFYRYGMGKIDWYDSKRRLWTDLKGLEILPMLSFCGHVKLVDYGGKMAVLWLDYVYVKNDMEIRIWCAEIAIQKRQKGEIWGMVEWFEVVYTTNERYNIAHALATTI